MLDSDDRRRWRAAHHEAAHAVFVVAEHFILGHAFLTRGTTLDGSLGGCTNWWVQDPASAEGRARVFYAGQYAERYLSTVDLSVRVPAHDENWNNDDDDAAGVLTPVLKTTFNADSVARRETADLVRRYWRAIVSVARGLYERPHDPVAVPTQCKNAAYLPDSRVVPGGEVRRYFFEDRIAEVAFANSARRGFSPGSEVEDWLAAQKQVAIDYREAVHDWIADDNVGNPVSLAEFLFASVADAQRAQASLVRLLMTGLGLQVVGDRLMVTLAQPELAALVIRGVHGLGGDYVRRRCTFPLR